MKILFIVRESELAASASAMLASAEHVVELVQNFSMARQIAWLVHDLVILDLEVDSNEAMGLLRDLRAISPHTPLLVLIPRFSLCDCVTATESGADEFLAKPFLLEDFLARVQAAVVRSREG